MNNSAATLSSNGAIKKEKRLSFDGYKTQGDFLNHRIAHLLLWLKSKYPGSFVSMQEIAQHVYGYKRLPSKNSKEVAGVRSAIGRVKPLLKEKHGCSTITVAGRVRATFNATDQAQNEIRGAVNRVDSATKSLGKSLEINKTETIKDPVLKSWTEALKTEVPKTIDKMARIRNLLAPPKKE